MTTRSSLIAVYAVSTILLAVHTAAAGADAARGKNTYAELCSKCHGAGGKGDGKDAATLTTKPKDLTDCTRMKDFTDDHLFDVIKRGGAAAGLSKDMPPYADALEDDEIRDTIAFIRTLCAR